MDSLTDLSTPAQFQSELPGQFKSQEPAQFHRNNHLSKVENSNKFAKAISHGNNQQLIGATYREQLTAEGCKRLIANSINCWNLLHLSETLAESKKPADREALLKNILATSTHSWEHINLLPGGRCRGV